MRRGVDQVDGRFAKSRHEHVSKQFCRTFSASHPLQEVRVGPLGIPVGTDSHKRKPKLADTLAIHLARGDDDRLTPLLESKADGEKWL
jgi:hypothetical protein